MSTFTGQKRSKFTIENLEKRELFAGDVGFSYDFWSGDLTLRGDNAGNEVDIYESTTAPNRLVVRGLNGTTIGGLASRQFTVPNWDDITIDLNGGNDKLWMRNISISNSGSHSDLRIRMDSGDDFVYMDNVRGFGDDVDIETGSGNDRVWMRGLVVADDLEVDTHSGHDTLTAINVRTGDDAYFRTHDGNDRADLFNVDAGDQLAVYLGSGNDYLEVEASSAARPTLNGGHHYDTIKRAGTGYYANEFNELAVDSNFERIL